jgi:hypothetical protein
VSGCGALSAPSAARDVVDQSRRVRGTLAIDDQGRRWIAGIGNRRVVQDPLWCVLPEPGVAMLIDRSLADFVVRSHNNERRACTSQWLTVLKIRARKLWASRHTRATALPVACSHTREMRG